MSSQVDHCFSPARPSRTSYRFMKLKDNFSVLARHLPGLRQGTLPENRAIEQSLGIEPPPRLLDKKVR